MKLISYVVFFLAIYTSHHINAFAAKLSPEVQRDVMIIKLSEHLKAERWNQAAPLFTKIDSLNKANNFETDDAMTFYRGEVAFHLENYDEAYNYLSAYISKAGNSGDFYIKSLTMISAIEEVDLNKLARNYLKGKKSPKGKKDIEKALRLYKLSAELGSVKAHFELSELYSAYLKSVYKYGQYNYPEAASWLLKIAQYPDDYLPKEVREAQKRLGVLYMEAFWNHGKPDQDGPKAIKWLTLAGNEAAGNSNPDAESLDSAYSIEARMRLAGLYKKSDNGAVIPVNWVAAVRLYESIKYRSKDEPRDWHKTIASYSLASIYLTGGAGVAKNLPEAEKLLRLCLAIGTDQWILDNVRKDLKQIGVNH